MCVRERAGTWCVCVCEGSNHGLTWLNNNNALVPARMWQTCERDVFIGLLLNLLTTMCDNQRKLIEIQMSAGPGRQCWKSNIKVPYLQCGQL